MPRERVAFNAFDKGRHSLDELWVACDGCMASEEWVMAGSGFRFKARGGSAQPRLSANAASYLYRYRGTGTCRSDSVQLPWTLDLKRVYATPFLERAGRLPLGQASKTLVASAGLPSVVLLCFIGTDASDLRRVYVTPFLEWPAGSRSGKLRP